SEAGPPWFTPAERLGWLTAPLLGAESDEVIVTNSTTGNLHQILSTLFHPTSIRSRILADELAFPSDLYAIRSHLELRGLQPADHLVLVGSADGCTLSEDEIVAAMDETIALAVLPAVLYVSGQLLDMVRLARAARA